jgi:ribosomal protein S18 acetylase RimI-like enzyme
VEIRRAGPEDAAAASAVAAATFRLACPPGISEESVAQFIEDVLSEKRFDDYLADPSRVVLLAQEGDEAVIGYTMLVFGEPYDADVRAVVDHTSTVELSKIYVLPDRHGGSVARPLMDASLRVARDAGADGIWLGVNQQNVRAQRFYEKSGFLRVGTKRFWVGDHWEDDYVLARHLP